VKTRTKLLTAGVAAVALTGGIGATIAAADPSTPAPIESPSASPTAKGDPTAKADRRANRRPRAVLRRAIHGEVTLGGARHRVVDFQRGTVQKVDATSITVASTDGFTATYVVTADTVVRKDKAKATLSDVKPQDKVGLIAVKDGSTVTAKAIRDRS
jgi:hypothetical protein